MTIDPRREDHLSECTECRDNVDALERIERTLSEDPAPPSDEARRRMWKNIDAARPRRAFQGWWPLYGLAAAAAAGGLWVALGDRGPDPQPAVHTPQQAQRAAAPVERKVAWSATESMELGAVQLENMGGESKFVLHQVDQSYLLTLEKGELDVEFTRSVGAELQIVTHRARIEVLGRNVVISASADATALRVDDGEARVSAGEDPPRTIRAGESWRVPEEAAAAAPPPPQPQPQPSPELRASPAQELEQLSERADRQRQNGELEAAAATYARAAAHPRGRAYREEALLRRAQILGELGRRSEALAALRAAQDEFPTGVLAPERAALAANLYLLENDPGAAAAALEVVDASEPSPLFQQARKNVARALEKK